MNRDCSSFRGKASQCGVFHASRFAWFFILSDFYGWPEEVLEALGESVREITFYPDNMERVMRP